MATISDRNKPARRERSQKSVTQVKSPVRLLVRGKSKSESLNSVRTLRSRLGLTQAVFARLISVSVRTLASLESGKAPTEAIGRRLLEVERLWGALSEVIQTESLQAWLLTPAAAFDGLKPLEVIERGQSDRLWEMVYLLRSGVPS